MATTPGKHVQNRGRAEFYAPPLKANGNKQQWGLSWWPVTGLISFCQSRVDSRGLQHHDKQTGTQIAGLVSITPRSSSVLRHFYFSRRSVTRNRSKKNSLILRKGGRRSPSLYLPMYRVKRERERENEIR